MSESILEIPPTEGVNDKSWFGYNYLGPGTDVFGKVRRDVQPVDDLDAAAKKHDLSYYNIANMYEDHLISKRRAQKLVDEADLRLAERAFVESFKRGVMLTPDIVSAIGSGDFGKLPNIVTKSLPSTLTSTVMTGKYLLSQLGIGRGSYVRLKRQPIKEVYPGSSQNRWPKHYY